MCSHREEVDISVMELLILNETREECLACNSLQEREKVASTYCVLVIEGNRVEFEHSCKY